MAQPGATMANSTAVKPFRALTWPDADTADSLLVQQCTAGDEDACARLVTDHQRMACQVIPQALSIALSPDQFARLDNAADGRKEATWSRSVSASMAK